MGNLSRYLIGLGTAIALAAGIVAIVFSRQLMVRQGSNDVPAGELVAGRRVGQTFQVSQEGLYRIDVLLATYARRNSGPVLFQVSYGPGEPALVTIPFDAAEVKDNTFRPFIFEPLSRPNDGVFYFSFQAPQAQPGNAITIWQTSFDSYPDGQVYVNDEPEEGDLAFVAYCRSRPFDGWRVFVERARDGYPYLWRARWLVLAAAVGWVLGVGLLLGHIITTGSQHEH